MPDFLTIEAGLLYGGDPDWFVGLSHAKRRRVLAYLLARTERKAAFWSASFRATDLAHLLSKPPEGGDSQGASDPLSSMLRFLDE